MDLLQVSSFSQKEMGEALHEYQDSYRDPIYILGSLFAEEGVNAQEHSSHRSQRR